MSLSSLHPLISTINDSSAKLVLSKAYILLLGDSSAKLLNHLCNSLEQDFRSFTDSNGKVWHKQNYEWITYHAVLSESSLKRAKKELLNLGLIEIHQEKSCDRTTYWRVCEDVLSRFFMFSHALRLALRPDNRETIKQWEEWASKNKEIIEEFRHLYPEVEKLLDPQPVMIRTRFKNKQRPTIDAGEGVKEKPKTSKSVKSTCKYVEYWNSLPHVPKCRIGTKAYTKAKSFFAAHKRYEAGQKKFVVTADEQERLKLSVVNKIPKKRQIGTKVPMRTHAEMLQHIDQAALMFSPEYYPSDKRWLRSLESFLYNGYSKKYGQTSMFLEKLVANPPRLLTESTEENLLANADDEVVYVLDQVQELYNMAHDRPRDETLSFSEVKLALSIGRSIINEYTNIPVHRVSRFAHHFGDYTDFVDLWVSFAQDHLWDGMPIGAFAVGKSLWNSFVHTVSADIGYDIFTGERI